MRPLLTACLTAFLALSLPIGTPGERCAKAQQGPSVEPGQTFTGKVAEVTDGDTFKVDRPVGPVVKVRLWGVDAPEFDQPYGVKARDAAIGYISRKTMSVQVVDVDRYGRAVVRVKVRGGNLRQMLVCRGLAWHYDEYAPNASQLARLERQARSAAVL